MVEQTHVNTVISVLSDSVYVYAQNLLVSETESIKCCWTSVACVSKFKCVADAVVLVHTFQLLWLGSRDYCITCPQIMVSELSP